MIAALIGLGALLPLGLLSALDFSSTEDDIEDDENGTHEHAESQEVSKIGLSEFLEQAVANEFASASAPEDIEDDTDEDLDDPRLIEYEGAIIDPAAPITPVVCVQDIRDGLFVAELLETQKDDDETEKDVFATQPIICRGPAYDLA